MSCPDVHTVSSCLTPGEEKRCPAQQFLVVLSVTVETERKRELQQRPGLRGQWQEERGDDSRKQFRNRARACASQAVLSVVSCQRLMSTWSEKVGWFGHGKVKQQAGAEDAPKGNLRGTQTLQPHGKGLFPPLYSTFIFITKLGAFSASFFLWGQIAFFTFTMYMSTRKSFFVISWSGAAQRLKWDLFNFTVPAAASNYTIPFCAVCR